MMDVPRDGEASLYAVLARNDGDPHPFGRLTAICHAALEVLGVTGAGVMLMAHGMHQGTAYATDDAMRSLEELQNDAAEGPCLDAYTLGRPVLEPDLAGRGVARWPRLAQAAAAAGMRAAFAFPLLLDDTSVGALDLYRDRPGPLSAAGVRDARVLAAMAAREVLAMQAEAPAGTLPAEIAGLSGDRATLEQATGMLAAQQAIPVVVAATRLRDHARAQGRSVASVATDIVARTLRIEPPDPA